MFNYPPLTDEKIYESLGLFPKGIYPFLTTSADYSVSKSDGVSNIVKIGLRINDYQNKSGILYCWLSEKMLYKIRHFWESVKCPQYLQSPPLSSQDWVNKRGFALVDVKNDPQYGPQNMILDFIREENISMHKFGQTKSPTVPEVEFKDDDLPF